jgi:hypothetical protein
MMAKADVSGRADVAIILAAAQRSRARERQAAQRSFSREASLPGCQTNGGVPDDVFRPAAIEPALVLEVQAIEEFRERERAVWRDSSPLAFASERRALSRQSRPLTARQCGPPAMHAVRTAAAKAAAEYLAFVTDLLQALDYCHERTPGQSAALARPAAVRFGPRALVRRVGELLETVSSPMYATAAGHLPTVWALFSEGVVAGLREQHGPAWRSAEAARLLRMLHRQARADIRLLHAGQPRRAGVVGAAVAPPRQAEQARLRVVRHGGAESRRATARDHASEERVAGFGRARQRG